MLQFITTLKCEQICRRKQESQTKCEVRKCCISKGFYACYECEIFEDCEKLKFQDELHGNSYLKNFRAIKQMGLNNWLIKGKRYWFGDE